MFCFMILKYYCDDFVVIRLEGLKGVILLVLWVWVQVVLWRVEFRGRMYFGVELIGFGDGFKVENEGEDVFKIIFRILVCQQGV